MSRRTPGPQPQPAELTILKGNPGKRKLPTPPLAEKPSQVPPVPSVLKDAGRESWRLYWTYGRAWLAYTDIPMVTRLCRLTDRAAVLDAALDTEGLIHESEKTGRSSSHFLLNNVIAVYKSIADLESAAGFTPSDRSRLKADAPADGDEVDKWMAQ